MKRRAPWLSRSSSASRWRARTRASATSPPASAGSGATCPRSPPCPRRPRPRSRLRPARPLTSPRRPGRAATGRSDSSEDQLVNYLDYYELAQEPFSNAPVSRFYFNSPQHSQALVRLTHLCGQMKGLGILVGGIGAGKTTLARRLLDSLPEAEYEAALLVIIHSGVTASWLLKRIALQLGVDAPSEDKLTLLGQLYQRLIRIYEQGKKAVVLIDEAQMLATRELMEEFRGLRNPEVPERKLLSIIFFGLPEIEQNLRLDPPLAQRVSIKFRLEHLNPESTESYIKHRLRLAGASRMPFTGEAVKAVHRFSGGTPRLINTLCDNALFEGYVARAPRIDLAMIERVAQDLGLDVVRGTETAAPARVAPPPPPNPANNLVCRII